MVLGRVRQGGGRGAVWSPCITYHKHRVELSTMQASYPGYQRTCSKSALQCRLKAKKTWSLVKIDNIMSHIFRKR